ncbi:Uncharacterised protein [Sphingobacterium spiritivorum]|uniref:Uncharacterized protein n=1 Tax=Sphingobacterium spiritivorum TaxID=258 RepID=A0A380BJU8_SPHSI|nr:hypothetical protein [Sphingobacterium spiritivorum]SUJ01603.1 Uncharacterised protein [Sphingobacterium spiritivorum]
MSKQDPQLIDYHSDYHQYLVTDIDMDRTDRYSYFQEIDSTTNIGIPIEVEHLSVNDARFRIGFSENEETVLLKYTKTRIIYLLFLFRKTRSLPTPASGLRYFYPSGRLADFLFSNALSQTFVQSSFGLWNRA